MRLIVKQIERIEVCTFERAYFHGDQVVEVTSSGVTWIDGRHVVERRGS